MARTTKQLSGGSKDKLIRALVAGEPGIEAEIADRLGDTLCGAIKEARVSRDIWEQTRHAPETVSAAPQLASPPATSSGAGSDTATFDCFAFSVTAVLSKKGREELAAKLATIANAADLYALAKAQHLGVDPKLTDVSALRSAIVAAAEARLSDRRAAAS